LTTRSVSQEQKYRCKNHPMILAMASHRLLQWLSFFISSPDN